MAGKDLFKSALKNAAQSVSKKGPLKRVPGVGGVRYRKGQTLGGAILGVFFGVILLIGSPVVLWMAESQNTAKDFSSATQIEATQEASGYVTFRGAPTVETPFDCGENGTDCLYYTLQNQELTTQEREYCGTPPSDSRILYETVMECDEDGLNCEQCYWIEEDIWQTKTESSDYGTAKVGNYTVSFNDGALMIGLVDETIMLSETTRDVWTYFPIPEQLLVAGDASSNIVQGAEKTYVLSTYDQSGTLAALESRDSMIKWILRAVAFLMLFIAFSSILGPISYLGHATRKIPFLGSIMKEGSRIVVGIVSFLLAIVCFAVLWFLITVIKNIFLIIGLVVLIGAIVFVVMRNKKS